MMNWDNSGNYTDAPDLPPPELLETEWRRRQELQVRGEQAHDVEASKRRCESFIGFVQEAWHVLEQTPASGPEDGSVPVSGSLGQDPALAASIDVLPWNRAEQVVDRIGRGDLAAVIMEAATCNSGAILPLPGYLEAVRDACTKTGTLLIFDEVIRIPGRHGWSTEAIRRDPRPCRLCEGHCQWFSRRRRGRP